MCVMVHRTGDRIVHSMQSNWTDVQKYMLSTVKRDEYFADRFLLKEVRGQYYYTKTELHR